MEALTGLGRAALNVPLARAVLRQIQRLGDGPGGLGGGEVLLVGEDEQRRVGDVLDDLAERLVRLVHAAPVGGVDDEDEAVRRRVVVGPELADRALAAEVAEVGLLAVELERAQVEALRRALLRHRVLGRERLEDRCLAGVVEAQDENARHVLALGTVAKSTKHVLN